MCLYKKIHLNHFNSVCSYAIFKWRQFWTLNLTTLCKSAHEVTNFYTQVVRNLGPLEWVLNTPSHHRVHHARNREAIDRNYAGVLIIWDRMFGTFEPERPTSQWSYGLTHPITTLDPIEIQVCQCCILQY